MCHCSEGCDHTGSVGCKSESDQKYCQTHLHLDQAPRTIHLKERKQKQAERSPVGDELDGENDDPFNGQ